MALSLTKRISEFEEQLKSTSTETNKPNIDKLSTEFKEFKSSVWDILGLLKSLTMNLSVQIDELDNQSRKNVLLFKGIEQAAGENLLSTVLNTVQVLMGLSDVQASAVMHCQRLGFNSSNRCRPILVRFNDISIKNLIWVNKRKLKSSSVVLSEFLTKPRQALFLKVRKHFGITNCWTQNCNILVKSPDNKRVRVCSDFDLDNLINSFPLQSSPLGNVFSVSKVAECSRISPAAPTGATVRPVTRKQTVRKP